MNCKVRIHALNQKSKYSAISLTARIHGSGNQNIVLEEMLLTLIPNNSLIKNLGIGGFGGSSAQGKNASKRAQPWFH